MKIFDINNVSEANKATIIPPVKTLIEFEKDYAVQVKDIQIETKAKEYDFESFDLNGKQYTTGFVITTNINDTETKGSQELVNTIFGGIVNDTIYGGTKYRNTVQLNLHGGLRATEVEEDVIREVDLLRLENREFFYFGFEGVFKGKTDPLGDSMIEIILPDIILNQRVEK